MAHEEGDTPEDVFLEDLRSERSLRWVTEENARALSAVAGPGGDVESDPLFSKLRAIYDDKKKIPNVRLRGNFVYNFWQDDVHVKGIWRRTSMADFKTDEPTWETVLDVDALAKSEQKSWVWKGPSFLDYGPGDDEHRVDRCVVKLSDEGRDACEVREFDVVTKRFVGDVGDEKDDGSEREKPFVLPSSKSNFCWIDRDTVWIGYDFGEGTMSPSGYPLTIREWRRGQDLSETTEIWRGQPGDVVAAGSAYWDKGVRYHVWYRAPTFYDTEHFVKHPVTGDMMLVDIPSDFGFNTFADHVVVHCKSEWKVGEFNFKAGSVVAHPAADFINGDRTQFTTLYSPDDDRCAYAGSTETKDYLLVHTLEHMVTRVYVWRFVSEDKNDSQNSGAFEFVKTHVAPDCKSFGASGVDSDRSNELWITTDGYLEPVTLSTATAPDLEAVTPCKENTAWFETNGMTVELKEAMSDDETLVPYFLVKGKDVVANDVPVPTVLYGYGGFEISMTPGYSATVGESFLAQGMCYAVACIRGGGEFGAQWHRAAKKEKRWRAYEDFAAVAKHLVDTKVTTHPMLGCMGGSNGGLLAGAMMVHYPHLFGAVVSQCPLLDMERYVLLTSGPSWIDEYGDPNHPAERTALLGFSPYHNLEKSVERATSEWGFDAQAARRGEHLPATLFTTSTADDRVHPSHARRVVHKARALGIGAKVLYHEMIEGGHAGAADNVARAKVKTVENSFLVNVLKKGNRGVPGGE